MALDFGCVVNYHVQVKRHIFTTFLKIYLTKPRNDGKYVLLYLKENAVVSVTKQSSSVGSLG